MLTVPLFSSGLVNKYDARGGPHSVVVGYDRGPTIITPQRATPLNGYLPYPNDNPNPWSLVDFDIRGNKSSLNSGTRSRQRALGRTSIKQLEALAKQGRLKAIQEIEDAKEYDAKKWLINNPNHAAYKNDLREPVPEIVEPLTDSVFENMMTSKNSIINSQGEVVDADGDAKFRGPETQPVKTVRDELRGLNLDDLSATNERKGGYTFANALQSSSSSDDANPAMAVDHLGLGTPSSSSGLFRGPNPFNNFSVPMNVDAFSGPNPFNSDGLVPGLAYSDVVVPIEGDKETDPDTLMSFYKDVRAQRALANSSVATTEKFYNDLRAKRALASSSVAFDESIPSATSKKRKPKKKFKQD